MPLFIRPERHAAGDVPHKPRERLSGTQIRLLLGLYAGYSSMMFSRATLDVAIPLMLEDASTGLDPGGIGTLLTLASFFYLFGKVSMGYGVDRCGARFVFLWLASFVSAGLTYLMSASATPASMTVIMCALCIAQSSGWAAMTSLVSLWLEPSQFAMAFGFLSTSSRMGDLASKVVLGTAVADGWAWRSLFLVAAALQLAVALANAALLPKHNGKQQPSNDHSASATGAGALSTAASTHTAGHPPSSTADAASAGVAAGGEAAPPSWAHIRAVVTSRRFAAVAAAVAALHVVMEFDKYIPLYLHKSLSFPPGLAAQGAALYPFAQLLALGAAGVGYDRLTPKGRLWTTGGLCALVVVFYALQLALRMSATAAPDSLHLALIFLSGAAVAVPYYLPASIYLAEVGGRGKCGTLSGLLDASGGVAAMGFHSLVGKLASREQWGTLLALLTFSAVVGWAAIIVFHRMPLAGSAGRHERRAKKGDPDDISSTEMARLHHHHHHLSSSLGSSSGSSSPGSGESWSSEGRGLLGAGLIPRVLGWLLGVAGEGAGDMPRKRRSRKDSEAVEDFYPLLGVGVQRGSFLSSSHHLTV